MDLKAYFAKVRAIERDLPGEYVVVASVETVDGGRQGVFTEVKRELAAHMIVDLKARLATEQEAREYRGTLKEVRS